MSRYKSYKNSGIDWIGDIPTSWKLRRFKSDFSYVKGKNPKETYYADDANGRDTSMPYLSMEYLRNENIEGEFPLVEEKLVSVDNNETLLLWDGSNAGEFIKSKKGFLSSTMVRIDHSTKINGKYSFYIFLCYERILRDFTNGMGIPHVNGVLLNNSYLPITIDEAEQLSIAEYLDDQTQKIDQLITNKKAQAEKLKELRQIEINNAVTKGLNPNAEMKDSGIDWLGKIPKHWEVKRIKDYGKVLGGYAFKSGAFLEEGKVMALKITNVQTMQLVWEDIEFLPDEYYEQFQDYSLQNGDLVFALTRPVISTGIKAAIAFINNEDKILINQRTGVFKPSKGLVTELLYFIVLSDYFFQDFNLRIKTTNQPNISTEEIARIKLVVPPREEQIQIADYLQSRTNSLDKLIKSIEAQIEKLQELRKIKIYEAVTGKIKVNSYAETTA